MLEGTTLSVSEDGRYLIIRVPVKYILSQPEFDKTPAKLDDILTPRELQVFELAVEGMCNKEIASSCNISLRTAKAHLSFIYRKLGIKSRLDLMRLYRKRPAQELVNI